MRSELWVEYLNEEGCWLIEMIEYRWGGVSWFVD